jgi:hypothetical protein
VALTDEVLLYLAWPPSAARTDAAVVLAVTTFTKYTKSQKNTLIHFYPVCPKMEPLITEDYMKEKSAPS